MAKKSYEPLEEFTLSKVNGIHELLVNTFFNDGKYLQAEFNINARKIVTILLESELEIYSVDYFEERWNHTAWLYQADIYLPYSLKSKLSSTDLEVIKFQLEKILDYFVYVNVKTKIDEPSEKWKEKTLTLLDSNTQNNQGNVKPSNMPNHIYDSLFFRSLGEIEIYKEFIKRETLCFPLPVARKGTYFKREPDFIVIYEGLVAIVEVDSDKYHNNLEKDNLRNDVFLKQGIQVIHRSYDECIKDPIKTVDNIIEIMKAQSK